MSDASQVINELESQLKNLKVDGWKYEIDRDGNRLDLSDKLHFGLDTDKQVLTIDATYNDANGAHTVSIGTRFKSTKHERDVNDTLVIDGVVMTNVFLDKDLMLEGVHIEARYTKPGEVVTEPASGDNMETFNPGGGQHEIRFIKSVEFDSSSIIGKLINLIKEAVS